MKKSIIEFINFLSKKKSKREKGEVYILSIAIDDYNSEHKLNYCKRDSEYLIDVIIDKSFIEIKQKNIYKIYDQEATKTNIYRQFRQLNKIITPKDKLIFHVAGHSNIEFNTNFFIPYDGDRTDIHTNISTKIITKFITNANHTSCILIFNTFNKFQHQELYQRKSIENHDVQISKSKLSVYSELIRFLENSEQNVNKSVWHFTKSKSTSDFLNPIEVYDDTRQLNSFIEETKIKIDKLINQGNYAKALQQIVRISSNNDIKLRDQADALLHYMKEKEESIKLIKPIENKEVKGITINLVHKVHESGYYLVPSPALFKEPIDKPKAKIILYASADTADQSRLRLDEEYRAINLELLRSPNRDEFELIPCLSSRITDLQRELLEKEPYIVHFTGHGSCKGICMVADDSGNTQIIKNKPLGGLFKLFAHSINCVFLNSCYSTSQSTAIGEHIENVICMSSAIYDTTAIKFASAFYMALGSGKDIQFSFEFAKNSIDLQGCSDKDLPTLIKKTA